MQITDSPPRLIVTKVKFTVGVHSKKLVVKYNYHETK